MNNDTRRHKKGKMVEIVSKQIGGNQGKPRTVKCIEEDQKSEKCSWKKVPDKHKAEYHEAIIKKNIVVQMVRAAFTNHFYHLNEKVYKQLECGPICLKAKGTVTRCVRT